VPVYIILNYMIYKDSLRDAYGFAISLIADCIQWIHLEERGGVSMGYKTFEDVKKRIPYFIEEVYNEKRFYKYWDIV